MGVLGGASTLVHLYCRQEVPHAHGCGGLSARTQVAVHTSDRPGASSNGPVTLLMHGERGCSAQLPLDQAAAAAAAADKGPPGGASQTPGGALYLFGR